MSRVSRTTSRPVRFIKFRFLKSHTSGENLPPASEASSQAFQTTAVQQQGSAINGRRLWRTKSYGKAMHSAHYHSGDDGAIAVMEIME